MSEKEVLSKEKRVYFLSELCRILQVGKSADLNFLYEYSELISSFGLKKTEEDRVREIIDVVLNEEKVKTSFSREENIEFLEKLIDLF